MEKVDNKKTIKSVLRRLRFYDRSSLAMIQSEVEKLDMDTMDKIVTKADKEKYEENLKAVKRFKKETEIVTLLFNVYAIENLLPRTLDYLENPTGKPTKNDVKISVLRNGVDLVEKGGFTFIPMKEEDYNIYLEILEDWKH